MILSILLAIAVIFAVYHLFLRRDSNKKPPPGPWGLPIIGHAMSITKDPHLSFIDLANRYGPIFTANLGMQRNIVIDDLDMVKEINNDPVFSGRPNNKVFTILSGGKHGIIMADGDEWVEQRRFTLRLLRDFGFGKNTMEFLIMDEVQEMLDWLKKQEEQPVSLHRRFSLAVLNSLWMILTGQRYSHDDPKLNHLLDTASEAFNTSSASLIALFMPKLAETFPKLVGWDKLIAATDGLLKFFRDTIEKHERFPADPDHPRDFIDVYFNEIRKTTNLSSTFYGDTGRRSLLAVIGNLHGAGSETTSTTLNWAILYLLKYQDIQKKFQAEIDDVIGKSRLPCLADKSKMPYTEALMYEILRKSSIVPLGVFHNTMADTIFHGYFIANDTMVNINHYSIHHNPKIWGDPENFRPERFLSADGKKAIKHEALIPFGGGKRVCLGETLARDEIFLFMTSIFQQFEVLPDPVSPNPSLEGEFGMFLAPKKFTVIMKDRTG